MWLPWKWGVVVAVGMWLGGLVVARFLRRDAFAAHQRVQMVVVRSLLGETAVIMALYSLWQVAGSWSVMGVNDAVDRARWVMQAQRYLPLPSELEVQRLILPYPLLVKAANDYYAIAHVPALVATLIWGFLSHRIHYGRLRNAVALTTLGCLLVQLVPLAPPRMLDDLGFIDTAVLYDQSVYSALGRGMAGQLAAMPSVHVAWALIVPWFAIAVAANRFIKLLCVMHCALTWFVVVATANHFWLDGIAAACLFGLALALLALPGKFGANTSRLAAKNSRLTSTRSPTATRAPEPGNRLDGATTWQASSDRSPTES